MEHKHIIMCECGDFDHQVVLERWKETNQLVLSFRLNDYLPWHKRLFLFLKYVFLGKSTKSPWSEVVLSTEDVAKMNKLIYEKYIIDCVKERVNKRKAL